ncbi:NAD(P)-dependent oxidoreductase [Sphingomonas sp. SUN039]|uniref:NAD(P)-dependent oxidoreductase n=1 Tax=Sphingomonas sp. SUN039 TaxID=2937787 RepID=UPI00216418B1|nr:NAD(P)-dependent oxidoreductase [Sphingomonas sp. SUN039]UVO55758.1 NAD(P)-dependent oxidoreductase [Sphingomonas sp. SUN039]
MTCVGFIGLGSQGGSMARRIVEAGFPLTLWARRAESLSPYADTAAATAESIAALGAVCDHVGICVVDDAGVRAVMDELLPAMKPGSVIVIHSTIHPDSCKALAAQAAARGVALLDAPVSGGGPGAAAGTLTVMVGGDADALATARPVLETFAGLIVHLGDVGAGQTAKLVNNTLMAANMALAHHALASGEALGIDRTALADLVKASSGRSFGLEVYARLPTPQAFGHGGKLLAKDVGLLGALLGDDPAFAALRDVARPFLDLTTETPS